MKNPHKLFQKLFIGMAFLLVVLQALWLGMDLQAGDGKEATTDAILLAFWILTLGLFTVMNRQEAKLDRELEESRKNLDNAMEGLLGHLKEKHEHEERIAKGLHDANKAVAGDRAPKPSEYKKVEAKFHELTGLYLKLSAVKGDKRPGAEVSDEPFTTPTTKKKAPAKKGASNVKAKARR